RTETIVTHLYRVAKGVAVNTFGQKLQERFKIIRVKSFRGHKLPIDHAELVLKFQQSTGDEAFYTWTSLGQNAPICRKPRRFERKNKVIRCLLAPSCKSLWFL